jgi:hypothetical protein
MFLLEFLIGGIKLFEQMRLEHRKLQPKATSRLRHKSFVGDYLSLLNRWQKILEQTRFEQRLFEPKATSRLHHKSLEFPLKSSAKNRLGAFIVL